MSRYADFANAAAVFGAAPAQRMPPSVLTDYDRLATGLRESADLHALSIAGVDRLVWWQGLDEATEKMRREQWMDALVADLDCRYLWLKAAVAQRDIATSRTMHRWLSSAYTVSGGYAGAMQGGLSERLNAP